MPKVNLSDEEVNPDTLKYRDVRKNYYEQHKEEYKQRARANYEAKKAQRVQDSHPKYAWQKVPAENVIKVLDMKSKGFKTTQISYNTQIHRGLIKNILDNWDKRADADVIKQSISPSATSVAQD